MAEWKIEIIYPNGPKDVVLACAVKDMNELLSTDGLVQPVFVFSEFPEVQPFGANFGALHSFKTTTGSRAGTERGDPYHGWAEI